MLGKIRDLIDNRANNQGCLRHFFQFWSSAYEKKLDGTNFTLKSIWRLLYIQTNVSLQCTLGYTSVRSLRLEEKIRLCNLFAGRDRMMVSGCIQRTVDFFCSCSLEWQDRSIDWGNHCGLILFVPVVSECDFR